ncbi:MAG TPA: ATP-dependent DNA helicase [Candidatus Dormibacteraeota bacterium]
MSLTQQQLVAAHADLDAAHLIAAGPGTGKTTTMVERFCWLHREQKVPVDRILAVTFTDRAAAELQARIQRELGHGADLESAWIGTFHAICARLLREHAYLVGVPRELRVLDDTAQRLLVDDLRDRLRSGEAGSVDLDSLKALTPDDVGDLLRYGLGFALRLKGRGISPDRFRDRARELHEAAWPNPSEPAAQAESEAIDLLHMVYATYEQELASAGASDFDDLILAVIGALDRSADFRTVCRRRFQHLLVDEFQDTNRIQMELIRLLAAPDLANVVVVGDAKQSIYGWRDAEIENIRTFPGVRLDLTENHRSPQEVCDLATFFIRRDEDFKTEPALVAAHGSRGAPAVSVGMASDPAREAGLIAGEIVRLHEQGTAYSDIAILSHTLRYLPNAFEEELRARGIPYVTSGGSGFFDREEVKDVVALLRLTSDPLDDGALARVLQGPLVRLDDAGMYPLALRRLGRRGVRLRDCWEESRAEGFPEIDAVTAERGEKLLAKIDAVARRQDALTVADVLNRLLEETGYLRHAQLRAAREGPRILFNLRKAFRMAAVFESGHERTGDFIRHLDRMVEAEVPVPEAEAGGAEAVRLLTIHAAKGLEFPIVFLVNLRPPRSRESERLFFDPESAGFVMRWWRGGFHPRFQQLEPASEAVRLHRQERRRAVYVALTRASQRLYVTASRSETAIEEVDTEAEHDHFAEILGWVRTHPESGRLLAGEQLELPVGAPAPAGPVLAVDTLIERLQRLERTGTATAVAAPPEIALSFSQLHAYEVCPVRYRLEQVWQVPAPPDELLPKPARRGSELGASVHEALREWHERGGSLEQRFLELADSFALEDGERSRGAEMLQRYLQQPLASAPTLGTEIEFTLRFEGVRVRGAVDRVAELGGRSVLVDYKTNRTLDRSLREAYSTQLRIYALAAGSGLLPGGSNPRLAIYHLPAGELIEVEPDAGAARARVLRAAEAIRAGDYEIGPEHAARPCFACAYRPACSHART